MKKNFSWDDLRFFIATATQRSVSSASTHLGVEHTTVTRRITSLENSIQLKLFNRLPKSWTLTAHGEMLLKHALEIENNIATFQRKADSINPLLGKIKISAPPILISHFFAKHHVRLASVSEDIEIEWIGEKRIANLNMGEADLAIRLGDLEDSNLKMRKLGNIEYGIYQHVKGPLDSNYPKSFINFGSPIINMTLYNWYSDITEKNKVHCRTDDFLTTLQLLHTPGVRGLLPAFLASTDNQLISDDSYTDIPAVPASLLIHADIATKPIIKYVADELVSIFKEYF